MEAVKWDCVRPRPGTVFDPATMVNENRMLYGDVLWTVQCVMGQPGIYEVRFAMSPTITRAEYGGVTNQVRQNCAESSWRLYA
jgi:hypothetical protein